MNSVFHEIPFQANLDAITGSRKPQSNRRGQMVVWEGDRFSYTSSPLVRTIIFSRIATSNEHGGEAYSRTLMADVAPAPKMYIFFALFNAVGKTSGFVGPFISTAVIDDDGGNTNAGFYFSSGLTLVGIVLLLCVNVDQAKANNAKLLEIEREQLYASHGAKEVAADVVARNPSVASAGTKI